MKGEGAGGGWEAQGRAGRTRAFREQLDQLDREGALRLTADQRGLLGRHDSGLLRTFAARFDVDTTPSQKRISRAMRIATTIAGIALCAAAVLFPARDPGLRRRGAERERAGTDVQPGRSVVIRACPLID